MQFKTNLGDSMVPPVQVSPLIKVNQASQPPPLIRSAWAKRVSALAGLKAPAKEKKKKNQLREKAMAPYSSTVAQKIPWMEEPDRLQSMGSLRVRHD